jgi:hypothetical protein
MGGGSNADMISYRYTTCTTVLDRHYDNRRISIRIRLAAVGRNTREILLISRRQCDIVMTDRNYFLYARAQHDTRAHSKRVSRTAFAGSSGHFTRVRHAAVIGSPTYDVLLRRCITRRTRVRVEIELQAFWRGSEIGMPVSWAERSYYGRSTKRGWRVMRKQSVLIG